MSPTLVAAIVFVAVFGGAMFGMGLHNLLPPSHLSPDSKEVVKLGMGLISTMTALVLGLVTASAKGDFDAQDTALKQSTAQVVMLDRLLAQYGPEAAPIRERIQALARYRLALTWPEEENLAQAAQIDAPGVMPTSEGIAMSIRDLQPTTDAQRFLQARAFEIAGKLLEARWLMLGSAGSSVPMPFLTIVVFWLSIIFASFGLLAPRNATVVAVLFVCALSVAASLFLIIEMDDPFHGVMKISSAPIRYILTQLGQ
jgi:hypothetical protein